MEKLVVNLDRRSGQSVSMWLFNSLYSTSIRACLAFVLTLCFCVGGCTTSSKTAISVKGLAKSDVDLVADLHRRSTWLLLRDLHIKLYRRNPAELKKTPGATISSRWQMLTRDVSRPLTFRELDNASGIYAMRLAFNENYQGDRVFAIMAGLTDMLNEAYGYKNEFFIIDSVNDRKLTASARNIETLVWMLRSKRDSHGRPLVLADTLSDTQINLSFERLFGKLIAHQDMLASIAAGKSQRAINSVAQSLVSMTFMPL